MKLHVKYYTQFKRDIKRAKKRHLDIGLLEDVVKKLQRGEKLDAIYRDHKLSGEYEGYRECHIQPNWLLVYKIIDEELILALARTGTHDDVFTGY